jgi:hypothetical protein
MIQPAETRQLRLRLVSTVTAPERLFGKAFDSIFAERQRETDEFYTQIVSETVSPEPKNVIRQGYAGLLWSKQFYHYVVADWLAGDSAQPPPPSERRGGRNREWGHVYSRYHFDAEQMGVSVVRRLGSRVPYDSNGQC